MKPAVFIVFLAMISTQARGDLIFSQGPPNGNDFDITNFRLADDFTLAADVAVSGIGFWYAAQFQTDLSIVTYAVYQDTNGALGSSLQSESINNVSTSFDSSSGLFFTDFAIFPLPLVAGKTYWLELHAGSSLTDTSGFTISWAAADDNTTYIALENTSLGVPDSPVNFTGFDQYAFELNTTPVPEPPSAILLLNLFVTLLVFQAVRVRKFRIGRIGEQR